MNVLKLTLLFMLLSSASSISAQSKKGCPWGEYTVKNKPRPVQKIDSSEIVDRIRIVASINISDLDGFHSQTLKLKWFGRFTITDTRPIPAIGLNTDHPKIHGNYRIKHDTLILIYRYSVQHFSKNAPKARVKKRFKKKDGGVPMKRFAREAKKRFKVNDYRYWGLKN